MVISLLDQGGHAWEQHLLECSGWMRSVVWPTHVSQTDPGAHRKGRICLKSLCERWGREAPASSESHMGSVSNYVSCW